MKIKQAVFAAGKSAFFFDDQQAIRTRSKRDGFMYLGQPLTPGFSQIRVAGESISVLLLLENGHVATGDCAAVQYSGVGGRDPLFLAQTYLPFLRRSMAPLLAGRTVDSFQKMTNWMETLSFRGHKLHTAIKYGLSQAFLNASAIAKCRLPCEIIADEYRVRVSKKRVPIFGQTGDNRYENADKMILKGVDVLPHGLFNHVSEKLGRRGEKLADYIRWLCCRIKTLRPNASYHPVVHIDVYGTIGLAFDVNIGRMADYMASLESMTGGLPLYIEGPVDMGEKQRQMETLLQLRTRLRKIGSKVCIVADEWCNTLQDIRDFTDAQACDMIQIKTPDLGGIQNTIESVIYCKKHGLEAYLGGTCNETDLSCRACVQVALATRADRILAKPGMGFDEGFSIVNNEMERTLAVLKTRSSGARS